ncbi:MAG: hypothetical protein L0387_39385 [Acidobacteria bacterium]|nr:hypothetical protein [Acidobacteriota bacterium]
MGDIPVTIADLLFGLFLVVLVFAQKPTACSPAMRKCRRLLLVGVAFFAARVVITLIFRDGSSIAEDLARFVPLCIYPLLFFAMVKFGRLPHLAEKFGRLITYSVIIVLLYGLTQKLLGEYAVLIPGVTANWHDAMVADFLADKSNLLHQLDVIKLTSTYQNGNLLGVNLLLLLPIAIATTKRRVATVFVIIAGAFVLVFTASRATWVGAAILALLGAYAVNQRAGLRILFAAMLAGCIAAFVLYAPIAQTRISDAPPDEVAGWSGRLQAAAVLGNELVDKGDVLPFLIGTYGQIKDNIAAQGGGPGEMFYLSMFEFAGLAGILIWMAPIAVSFRTFFRFRNDNIMQAVMVGLATWCCVAVAEGAFWLPPTGFNLWAVVAIGWLRAQELAALALNERQGLAVARARQS